MNLNDISKMNEKLPIGVLLPTRNAMARLPDHVKNVVKWADRVSEIIVVDSQSKDGTVEHIRASLQHPNLRYFEHPPGLYQSWNHGIAQISQPYTYISTIGDAITGEDLEYLCQSIETCHCDVVVSPPRLQDERGNPVPRANWPVHDIIEQMRITAPRVLDRKLVFAMAAYAGVWKHLQGVLGSSASNLYRTDTLKRLPFPTTVGTVGDVFWGVRNAFKARLAMAPRQCGSFMFHDKGEWGLSKEQVDRLRKQCQEEVQTVLREEMAGASPAITAEESALLGDFLRTAEELELGSAELNRIRKNPLWIVNSHAWQLRSRRNELRAKLATLWQRAGLHP